MARESAIIKTGGNHVYVLPLDGSPVRDLTVAGWSGFIGFDWSVDGKGFFISNTRGEGLDSNLLFVDLNGKPQPVMATKIRRLHLGRSFSGRPAFGHFGSRVQWQHVDDREFLNRRTTCGYTVAVSPRIRQLRKQISRRTEPAGDC